MVDFDVLSVAYNLPTAISLNAISDAQCISISTRALTHR